MKRPTMLYQALLKQFSMELDLSVERDVQTIARRFEHEGLSFLTITLPILSDALEQGIESGRFSCPSNFARHGSLPRFMGGFFKRVFDIHGELLPDPSADAILAIRQVCRFMKKLKMNCSASREAAAVRRYKAVEDELFTMTPLIERKDEVLDQVAGVLWSQVFPETDPSHLVCRHGPGVTADRYLPNGRYKISYWYDRAERWFPSDLHAFHNYGRAFGLDGQPGGLNELDYLDVRREPAVRVVFVPKTLTTPRVIAIEPSTMQYMQQALLRYMVPLLESHRLTRDSLRFTDQTPNQRLAYKASIDRRLATLDLKDASDRVHFELVRRILGKTDLLDYIEAARSLHADLPDGTNTVLSKFASMGSATCFPIEAMVFYTLVQAAMHRQDGRRVTSSSIRQYSASIDIYGDDIIIPVGYTDSVITYLESYGLLVNRSKSFQNSLFRESCGADYFNGQAVRPIYARQSVPERRDEWTPEHVMAWTATANLFYEYGMWIAADAVRAMVVDVLRSSVPIASERGAGIHFLSCFQNTDLRYNRNTYSWEQKRLMYTPSKRKDDIDGDATAQFNRVYLPGGRPHDDWISCHLSGWSQHHDDHHRERTRTDCELGRPEIDVRGVQGSDAPAWQSSRGDIRYLRRPRPSFFDVIRAADRGVIDFSSSTKRGVFKSKRRWVTTVS